MECKELDSMHDKSTIDIKNEAVLGKIKQLGRDVLARGFTTPGKTIEVVFDPSVQKGLGSGIYELVPANSGGYRGMARAVDSKKFVGHGRIVQAGKLKQIGVGVFHIASIAVAQAHLAEINKNLETIKMSVADITNYLEDKDTGDLKGTIDYLEYLVNFIRRMDSPDAIPESKLTTLEITRKEMMSWMNKIHEEANRLLSEVNAQKNEDTLGTGNTYNKIKDYSLKTERIAKKHFLLMRIGSLFYFINAYIDPLCVHDKDLDKMLNHQLSTVGILSLVHKINENSEKLLKSAYFNKKTTLERRRQDLFGRTQSIKSLTENGNEYFIQTSKFVQNRSSGFTDNQGRVHMAIKFDDMGNPEDLKFISQ